MTAPIQSAAMTDPLKIADALEKAFNEDRISDLVNLSWIAKEALRGFMDEWEKFERGASAPEALEGFYDEMDKLAAEHASAPEALSDEQIDAIQRDYMASYPCDVRRFARMIERAALAAPSTPAPDIADAVMDPDGVCPTCYQRLHVEHASTEALGVDAAIRWIRDNYQDHNIASLCDGLRALAAPSTPAAVAYVDGDDVSRRILWRDDVAAFDFPVGTTLFAAAPSTPAAAPVAWWRKSYIDESGNWDADVQIGSNKPTEQVIRDNGFEWSPLYGTPLAATQAQASATKVCEWSYESDPTDAWATGCGEMHSFTEGGPTENEFRFCCYCGGGLVVKGVAP